MQAQSGTWEDGFRLVEFLAERRDSTGAVRRTLRCQSNAQLRLGHFKIRRAGQSRLEKKWIDEAVAGGPETSLTKRKWTPSAIGN
jgi:hypothetical protein